MSAKTTALSVAILKHRATEAFRNRRCPDPWTKEKHHALVNARYQENKVVHLARARRWRVNHPTESKVIYRRFVEKVRREAMVVLGGVFCKACGYDSDTRALCIDHIHGGGQAEMRRLNYNLPKMYRAIVEMGAKLAQAAYQVLCANCNRIKQFENKEFGRGRPKESA